MSTRRSFLGQLIGFVAATPFLGNFDPILPTKVPQRLEGFRLSVRVDHGGEWAEHNGKRVYTSLNEDIWCPETCDVEVSSSGDAITFNAETLLVRQAMTCLGVSLYAPDGRFVTCQRYSGGSVAVCNGDLLNHTYTLSGLGKFDPNDWRAWTDTYQKNSKCIENPIRTRIDHPLFG